MKLAIMFILLTFTSLVAQVPGPGECTKSRAEYKRLNDHLLTDRQGVSDQLSGTAIRRTAVLIDFINQVNLARLSDMDTGSSITAYLSCMQDTDGERPWGELTNTPQVFVDQSSTISTAMSSLVVMRGGLSIPRTLPIFQCFARQADHWLPIGDSSEADFDSHSFFIQPLKSPIPGESWFLVSGRVIGAGMLKMEVISCGAQRKRKVWGRDNILWGEVQVFDKDSIKLTYVKQEDDEIAKQNGDKLGPGHIIEDDSADPAPKKFVEYLRVTSAGLAP